MAAGTEENRAARHGGRCMRQEQCRAGRGRKIRRGREIGSPEACVFLRTKMSNMTIVRRWEVRIGHYWRGFFLFFLKK